MLKTPKRLGISNYTLFVQSSAISLMPLLALTLSMTSSNTSANRSFFCDEKKLFKFERHSTIFASKKHTQTEWTAQHTDCVTA